jgi:hypothetical protein
VRLRKRLRRTGYGTAAACSQSVLNWLRSIRSIETGQSGAVVKRELLNRWHASREKPFGLRRHLDDPLATVAGGDPVRETDFVAPGGVVGSMEERKDLAAGSLCPV